MSDFLELTDSAWEEFCGGYRLAQLRRWVFQRKAATFDEMTDLSLAVRAKLTQQFSSPLAARILAHTKSCDNTEKLLVAWRDGNATESVLLRDDRHHRTGCISTQVGCAMQCSFCASGLDGFVRNLSRGEILEQILRLNALLPPTERLTHLVIMGTGEPLLNLSALLDALAEATSPRGLNLSARRVTVSTVGIPSGIRELANSGRPYKLAISLHAPNDTIRNEIIPHNKNTGVAVLVAAARDYAERVGRRVTIEYLLIRGVNDAPHHARELASLLTNISCVVNLIPLNEIPEKSKILRTPTTRDVHCFAETLTANSIAVKIRFRKGNAIDAACGQLRRGRMNSP